MITGGVDLAADPKRTALCAIDWSSGSIELSDGPVDDDAIVALAHRAPLSGWDVPRLARTRLWRRSRSITAVQAGERGCRRPPRSGD